MTNERLRSAIYSAGMTLDELSHQLEVDPKTIERWISKDRIPHRANRQRLALALGVHEVAIWPDLLTGRVDVVGGASEILRVYPSRGSIPTEMWISLIDGAQDRIDILAFAGSFLHDALPGFVDRVRERAASGVRVRLIFGNPESRAVAIRGDEEGIGDSLRERCRLTWKYLRPIAEAEGIEARQHSCTLYQSLFRFDDQILVNLHTFGSAANQAPVLHLHQADSAPLYRSCATAFEAVWEKSQPPS